LDWCEQTHFQQEAKNSKTPYTNKYLFEKKIAQAFNEYIWTKTSNKAVTYPRVSYGVIPDH
jgi:hypothetical protein